MEECGQKKLVDRLNIVKRRQQGEVKYILYTYPLYSCLDITGIHNLKAKNIKEMF